MTNGIVIAVRVTPRSARDDIDGVDASGELRVRVTAAPADGAANKAVTRLLAKTLGVSRGAVMLVSGSSSRHKRVAIDDVPAADVRDQWPGISIRQL